MITINTSKDQRPTKRKLNPIRADHVIRNLELDATKRLKLVDGIAIPLEIDDITNVRKDEEPLLLTKVTQLQENVLVYEKNGQYYVKKTPWKNNKTNAWYNFIGFIVDVPQFAAFLRKKIFVDVYIKTENDDCVYGSGPKFMF